MILMTLANLAALVPILAPLLALASFVAYCILDPFPYVVVDPASISAFIIQPISVSRESVDIKSSQK